jgi:hypothetical protein
MVTLEEPRAAPKPLPQIVTQTPWFFCPPLFGPLSRSEKKMLGGIVWAVRETGSARRKTSKGKNFMKEYLNTTRRDEFRWASLSSTKAEKGGYPALF